MLHTVSLGQGQDKYANDKLDAGHREGLWVMLQKSIKPTNEPPQGLPANMKRAFTFFKKEEIEEKESKIKTILFGLCYFHAMMTERRQFGTKGWNRNYPFSMGDLRDSSVVLQNYMDNNQASGKI